MGWKRKTLIGTGAVIAATYAGLAWVTCAPERPVVHPPRAGRLILTDVAVVDPRRGTVTRGTSVLMDGGRIVAVGRDGTVAAPPGTRHVEGGGRYMIPGLNDMHAHPLEKDDPSGQLALMLTYGVTGFRQMSGSDDMLRDRRESRLPIGQAAPRLLIMPGALLTPLNASRPDQVRATVRHEKAAGADFIKAGLVDGPGLAAALDEGRRIGITVSGHVPAGTSVVSAARGGMRAIEHLGPSNGLLIACSSESDRLLAELRASARPPKLPEIHSHIVERLAGWALLKRVVNPAAADHDAGEIGTLREALATYDDARCRRAARIFRKVGNWQVPTLIRLKSIYLADDPAFARDPALRYMPASEVATWRDVTGRFVRTYPEADRAVMRQGYEASLRAVRLLDQEGVRMLTGSDASGAGWLIPGHALHQEFDELNRAGLSPLRILQMATSDAADFLGRATTMGEVSPGRDADLVLLDGDPTRSVANLHRVDGVVRAGFYYDARTLAALRDRIVSGGGMLK